MAEEDMTWDEYYQKIAGRPPRKLLLDMLEKYPQPAGLRAIDLGCGDGTESAVLLSRGWYVHALDGEPKAIQRLLEKVPPDQRDRLQTQVVKFEELTLPTADLIYASVSIPFCHPAYFAGLWETIVQALPPGGRFAGQFLGVRDTWASDPAITSLTEAQIREMLAGFEVESFHEMDEDGQAASGPKHWHLFTVIARKK